MDLGSFCPVSKQGVPPLSALLPTGYAYYADLQAHPQVLLRAVIGRVRIAATALFLEFIQKTLPNCIIHCKYSILILNFL